MMEAATACVRHSTARRPHMSQVCMFSFPSQVWSLSSFRQNYIYIYFAILTGGQCISIFSDTPFTYSFPWLTFDWLFHSFITGKTFQNRLSKRTKKRKLKNTTNEVRGERSSSVGILPTQGRQHLIKISGDLNFEGMLLVGHPPPLALFSVPFYFHELLHSHLIIR